MSRVIAIFFLIGHLSISHAQSNSSSYCAEFNTPEKVRIYYVNGMLSDNVDNNNARTTLETTVGGRPDNAFRISVNRTAGFISDGLQASSQRGDEIDPVEFWQQWHGTNPGFPQTSPEFQRALADAIVAAATVQVNNDADLAAMVEQYLIDLNASKKVVLVAHSQGNFYANRAIEYIRSQHPQFTSSIGVVNVATPSGTQLSNSLLTQNLQDTVIFDTVASRYPVLPANVDFFGNDKRHHGFLTTYMLPANARNRISGQVRTIANQLNAFLNTECDDRVAKISTLSAKNIESNKADLEGDLSQGVNVNAWIVFDRNPDNVVCNGSGFPNTGPYSAPGTVSQQATALSPNTVYYMRACAKGPKGPLSDGGLKQFITKRNSGKIGIPTLNSATTQSFSLMAQVLEGVGIDTWFVRGAAGGFQNPSCLTNSGNYDGIGTVSAGDTVFSAEFTGLAHSSQYRVRGCAKGSDGVTNAGPVNIVQTTNVPTRSCSTQAFRGSTEGLSVIYNLGNADGFARVTFQSFTIPDALEIYKHNSNQLLLSTNGPFSGQFTRSFAAGGIDKVDVFVYGNSNSGTEWELTIECPQPL